MAQLVPEGAATLHLVIPGHMMEPGDHILRTGLDVVEGITERFWILFHVAAAIRGTIEAHSDAVSLMVVRRCPVGTQPLRRIPGLWTIMVPTCKDMMDTQRHHIVHTSLTTVEHHLLHRIHKLLLTRKGLAQPLVGNLLRGE